MRIALCVRHEKAIFRLVWINESKAGIYIGTLGAKEESHVSYHQDGTRHTKIGAEYHNRFSDIPIALHTGFKQLGHFSLSLTKNWFNAKTIYTGDDKTESIVLLDQQVFYDRDTLALGIWITDRASEQKLLEITARTTRELPIFHAVAELVSSLDYSPNQKIALTLHSARIRDVDPTELMFPPKREQGGTLAAPPNNSILNCGGTPLRGFRPTQLIAVRLGRFPLLGRKQQDLMRRMFEPFELVFHLYSHF